MAVDMFIRIGDVKGEAQDAVNKEWIDVLAWSWGMSQSGTTHVGGGGGAGKVNVQDLSLTKYIDKSSADLMLHCCNGKHYEDAELKVRKAGGDPLDYYIIKLTDVMVTSVSTGGSGGEDRLTENVTLNFRSVSVDYQPQKDDGTADGGKLNMLWNMATNKAEA